MNNAKKLKEILNQTWERNNLVSYAQKCVPFLVEIIGFEFNQGYLIGLSIFLYWQNLYEFTDEELTSYIKEIAGNSKRQAWKQIHARS